MRRWMIVVLTMLTVQVYGQYAGYKPLNNTDEFRKQFAKAAQATQTIQSDFVQDKNLSMLSDKITSTGKFWFKRENMVRMEYEKPSYYLMVINGNMIKTKDSKKETKISAKSNNVFEPVKEMIVDCVQGTAMESKNFTTHVFENATTYLVELTPLAKSMKGIFKTINLTVDKKDLSVMKIDMQEQSGDNTVMTFVHKQTNVTISDEVFSVK